MTAEIPAENSPLKQKHYMLLRHENGYDVIDTFEVTESPNGTEVEFVESIYASDLDLAYSALTGAKYVPPRAMPDRIIGPTLH